MPGSVKSKGEENRAHQRVFISIFCVSKSQKNINILCHRSVLGDLLKFGVDDAFGRGQCKCGAHFMWLEYYSVSWTTFQNFLSIDGHLYLVYGNERTREAVISQQTSWKMLFYPILPLYIRYPLPLSAIMVRSWFYLPSSSSLLMVMLCCFCGWPPGNWRHNTHPPRPLRSVAVPLHGSSGDHGKNRNANCTRKWLVHSLDSP